MAGICTLFDFQVSAMVSIGFSWASTAYKAYSISFNQDTDPSLRRVNASFYGYIPNRPSKRLLISVLLFVLCLTHIVGKTSALALLFVTNKTYVLSFLCVDMAVFLLYKIVRGDFYCWVPGTGILSSIVFRVLTKLMADMTGIPQLR
jgi:hypothetical protein